MDVTKMPENCRETAQNCHSGEDMRGKSPQQAYFYCEKEKVAAKPNDPDGLHMQINTATVISDSCIKSFADKQENLKRRSKSEFNRSRGYDLGPEVGRCPSRRDHVTLPKRTWTGENITRYQEVSSRYNSQRATDAIIQPQYEKDRHVALNQSRNTGQSYYRKGSPFIVADPKDYDQLQNRDGKSKNENNLLPVKNENTVHLLERFEEHRNEEIRCGNEVTEGIEPDNNFSAGKRSFMPIKIYPSKHEYRQIASSQNPGFSPFCTENSRSPEPPPNISLVRKTSSKRINYDASCNMLNCDGCREKSNSAELKSPENREGKRSNEPHLEYIKVNEQISQTSFTDRRMIINDSLTKRFRDETGRRECEDWDFESRVGLLTDETRYSPSYYKRICLENSRSKDGRDSPSHFTKSIANDRIFENPNHANIHNHQSSKYGFKECYVMRGNLDEGCSKFYQTPSLCSKALHEIDNEDRRKYPADERGLYSQGYKRCCCPCCPCYSALRFASRDHSPVSPRCHPRTRAVSPSHFSSSESRTVEANNIEPSVEAPTISAEMQAKLVNTRTIPHMRRRRNRTVYTHDQIEELEDVFKVKHYLDVDEKGSIAKRLGIRTENVEIWFKNRRAKWRKEMKASKQDSEGEMNKFLESPEYADLEKEQALADKSGLAKGMQDDRPTMTLYHPGEMVNESAVSTQKTVSVDH